jgi:ADP-ribose pyrophosphatase YjhB (NUDIX family)
LNNTQQLKWLEWAREIQALAQIGITYAQNEWQKERYDRLLGIAAEIVSEHTNISFRTLMEDFRIQPGYATPKIDVRGAVILDDKILMVREKIDDGWTMPGGWGDVGDFPAAAVEREVWEESGFNVKVKRLIGVYDANRVNPLEFYHAYKLVFLCDIVGGYPRTSRETTAVAFFKESDMPTNFAGERTSLRHIRDAFLMYYDNTIPTVFD